MKGRNISFLYACFSAIIVFTSGAAHADNSKVLYQCSQMLKGNLTGQSENTAATGSILITQLPPNSAVTSSPFLQVEERLADASGNEIDLYPFQNAFWGTPDGDANSDKANWPGQITENDQNFLKINAGNLTEEGEGRDLYRSQDSLVLNKQTGEIQLQISLRSCPNDLLGKCSDVFGSYKDVLSVAMKCTQQSE